MIMHLNDVSLYGLFVLTGVFSGFLSGLLSIGGAFVLVPAFLAIFGYFFQFESHFMLQLTLGTTMACMIVTAVSSTSAQNKRNSVYWEFLSTNWLYICVGTILGVILTNFFSTSLIKACFALFCLYSGYKMIAKRQICEIVIDKSRAKFSTFLFGTLCGFIGVGGANLFIPYLMKAEGIELKKAMGTASAIQIPVSIIGSASYLILGLFSPSSIPNQDLVLESGAWALAPNFGTVGYIYVPALLLVSLAGLYFNKIGVELAHKLPVPKLKIMFGGFTLLVGLKMAYNAIASW
jgi:uncharacterized membrane protein YfcA